MFSLDHDRRVDRETGMTVEQVRKARVSAYSTIRVELRKRSWPEADIPATDEGMFMLLQRLKPKVKL